MGTNYYAYPEPCEHCGRGDGEVHLGKLSGGWKPVLSFPVDGPIHSLDDWKAMVASGAPLKDEYGKSLSQADLLAKFRLWGESESNTMSNADDERLPNGWRAYRGEFS